MASRVHSLLFILFCVLVPGAAAAGQMLITVLRSSNPDEVHSLLGSHQPATIVPADRQRIYRTGGTGRQHRDQWQVVVDEGQEAFLLTGGVVPQLQITGVELSPHGPVPHVRLRAGERLHGIRVQARRVKHEIEVQLRYFADAGAGVDNAGGQGRVLATTLRGRPGQWLAAGGGQVPGSRPGVKPRYHTMRGDSRYFRILVRVDELD